MSQEKMNELRELSADVWSWFKEKDSTPVEKRDDLYWDSIRDDIAKKVKDCKYKKLSETYKDLLNAYAGQLQGDYLDYIATKQERLPI